MFEKIHASAFSVYCSLILSSALFAATPQSYQSAAMALPDAVAQVIRRAGWSVPADEAKTSVPNATPRLISVSAPASNGEETGPLSNAAAYVFQKGLDANLNGQLCTALGVTQNNDRFQVKQEPVDTGTIVQTLNVSRVRGRIDIIIFYKTATEGTLYLTSVGGDLEQAIHIAKGSPIQHIPLNVAKADFEKEKAWWLDRIGNSSIASTQP